MSVGIQVAPDLRGCVPRDVQRRLQCALRRGARGFGLDPGQVTLRLVGETEMAGLKGAHLGEEQATDVLSFPAPDGAGGDVALCWPVALRQAAASAQAPADEALRLVVHALAHLVGHDHGHRHEARRMLRAERRALRRLGVPDVPRPYDERGGRA